MTDVQAHLWARTNEGGAPGGGALDAGEAEGPPEQTRCGRLIGGGMILVAAAEEAQGAGLPLCEACLRACGATRGAPRPRPAGAAPSSTG